uniref:Uncharacterized protein n=1 Tax=Calidris pygmaea TaxID=425635 RepID=A0A8C3PM87_9CHAR
MSTAPPSLVLSANLLRLHSIPLSMSCPYTGGKKPCYFVAIYITSSALEEQIQNPYTELLVLKGHQDIVLFLVQIDDCRYEITFQIVSQHPWEYFREYL